MAAVAGGPCEGHKGEYREQISLIIRELLDLLRFRVLNSLRFFHTFPYEGLNQTRNEVKCCRAAVNVIKLVNAKVNMYFQGHCLSYYDA